MKNIRKKMAGVIITIGLLFASNQAYAQSEVMLRNQLIALLTQLLEQLQAELAAQQIQEVEDLQEEKEGYDVTKTDRYPQQTTNNVRTSARVVSVDGGSNDYIEYTYIFNLNAFGSNSYIPENFVDAFEFSIENGSGVVVYESSGIQNGNAIASFSSKANLDNGFYEIEEDTSEQFEITISYNPYDGVPAGIGSYRVQLDNISYRTNVSGSVLNYNVSSLSKFRTQTVNVIN